MTNTGMDLRGREANGQLSEVRVTLLNLHLSWFFRLKSAKECCAIQLGSQMTDSWEYSQNGALFDHDFVNAFSQTQGRSPWQQRIRRSYTLAVQDLDSMELKGLQYLQMPVYCSGF